VGHITCDNAANNGTMLDKFASCYERKTGKVFDVESGKFGMFFLFFLSCWYYSTFVIFSCLANIINLATQLLIYFVMQQNKILFT
jgi:hypothetical protein